MEKNKYTIQTIDIIRNLGFRPQVVGCFINQKKLLFLYNEVHKLWQLPQGGIDNNETIEDAVWREMAEEISEDFIKKCRLPLIVVGQDRIEFSKSKQNLRELINDTGELVYMKGKHYFFIAIKTNEDTIDISQSEFDNYQWLTFNEAIELSQNIYQKGKQRITTNAITLLQKKKYL